MEYAYQDVVVKGDPDRIKMCRLHDVIAVHQRYWSKEQQIFIPTTIFHYWIENPTLYPLQTPYRLGAPSVF